MVMLYILFNENLDDAASTINDYMKPEIKKFSMYEISNTLKV